MCAQQPLTKPSVLQSLLDLEEAIRTLNRIVEERMELPASERRDRVPVPASVLELAGAGSLVPGPLRTGSGRRYGEYTPAGLTGSAH